MPNDSVSRTIDSFRSDPLAWVALRHFLPAYLLRELLETVVTWTSGGSVALGELFEEQLLQSMTGLENWFLRTKPVQGNLAQHLQRAVQVIVWQSDDSSYPPADGLEADVLARCNALQEALELGTRDFGYVDPTFRGLTDGAVAALLDLMRQGAKCVLERQELDGLLPASLERLKSLSDPARVVVLKHLGDLCADSDAWQVAAAFYACCDQMLMADGVRRGTFEGHLHDLVDQSIAAAARVVQGPEAAVEALRDSFEDAAIGERPLLLLNGAFDLLVASYSSESIRAAPEQRTTLMRAPLSSASHHLDAKIFNTEGRYPDVIRRCWSVLRRQIALGLSTESRDTMAVFGRILLMMLEHRDGSRGDASDFALAVRLLVQAAERSGIVELVWTDKQIQYVDEATIDLAIRFASAHAGTVLEREQVLVSIFQQWVSRLPRERGHLTGTMIKTIVRLARDGEASGFANRDVAIKALEALRSLADSRPDVCRENIAAIHGAVLARLKPETIWTATNKAILLASDLAGTFTKEQLVSVVEGVLANIWAEGSKEHFGPLVQPALNLLLSDEAVAVANADADIGRRIVDCIVAFSQESTSGKHGLLHLLERFDASLVAGKPVAELGKDLVSRLMKTVHSTNSSAQSDDIRALLAVPALSGEIGLLTALTALRQLLDTAQSSHPGTSLPYAYSPILTLAHREKEIESVLHSATLQEQGRSILQGIHAVWNAAETRPTLLAQWSLPPATKANSVLVHNWTYATLRLAMLVDEEDSILRRLRAIEHPDLRSAIELALATGAISENSRQGDGDIATETDEAFYAGIGRRLVRVLTDEAQGRVLCAALLDQCLRRGPNGLDAGVLAEAHRLGVGKEANPECVHDYRRRLDSNRALRLGLWPLAAGLG